MRTWQAGGQPATECAPCLQMPAVPCLPQQPSSWPLSNKLTHSSTAVPMVATTIFSLGRIGPMRARRSVAACSIQARGMPGKLERATQVWSEPARPALPTAAGTATGTHLGRLWGGPHFRREDLVENQRRNQKARPGGHQRRLPPGHKDVGDGVACGAGSDAWAAAGGQGGSRMAMRWAWPVRLQQAAAGKAGARRRAGRRAHAPISRASLTHSRFCAAAVRYMHELCEEAWGPETGGKGRGDGGSREVAMCPLAGIPTMWQAVGGGGRCGSMLGTACKNHLELALHQVRTQLLARGVVCNGGRRAGIEQPDVVPPCFARRSPPTLPFWVPASLPSFPFPSSLPELAHSARCPRRAPARI